MSRFLMRMFPIFLLLALAFVLSGGTARPVAAQGAGSISGVVYFDTDMDGERDAGEPPAPGRTVQLLIGDDEREVSTVKSGTDGTYSFDHLLPDANYGVAVVRDSETPCTNGGVPFFSGSDKTTGADLGVAPPGDRSVSGTLVSDLNENGERDAGEPPLAGWRLRLVGYDAGECQLDSTTAANGEFEFGRLPKGTYSLSAAGASPSLPDDVVWELTFVTRPFDLPGAYPNMRFPDTSVDLDSSDAVRGMAFGLHVLTGTGSITAWTFHDLDLDGVRDEGEQPFDCCGVLFLRSSAAGMLFLGTAQDRMGAGHHVLMGLPAGSYTIALSTWTDNPTGFVDADGRPVRSLTLGEGEAGIADFGFGPQPPERTAEPLTPQPKPTLEPSTPAPFPPPGGTPASGAAMGAPNTGSGGLPSDSGLTGLAAALAVAGALAACGAMAVGWRLVARRKEERF